MPTPQNAYDLRPRPDTSTAYPTGQAQPNNTDPVNDPIVQEEQVDEPISVTEVMDIEVMAHSPHIQMPCFHGNPGERGDEWLAWNLNFAEAMTYNENKRRLLMPFYFRDHANVWCDSLADEKKSTWDNICSEF